MIPQLEDVEAIEGCTQEQYDLIVSALDYIAEYGVETTMELAGCSQGGGGSMSFSKVKLPDGKSMEYSYNEFSEGGEALTLLIKQGKKHVFQARVDIQLDTAEVDVKKDLLESKLTLPQEGHLTITP